MTKPMPHRFPQRLIEANGLQIISAADELFNHVDENLPMWSQDGDRVVRMDISFTLSFADDPVVTLGVTGVDASHDQNLRFWLQALDVKKEGFTIEFSTWSDTHIARVAVSWHAIGQVKPDIIETASKIIIDAKAVWPCMTGFR